MKFLFFSSLFFVVYFLPAQESLDQNTVDELNQLFATARQEEPSEQLFLIAAKAFEKSKISSNLPDSTRVRILLNLAHAYDYGLEDIEQAINHYKQALVLQKKINSQAKIYVEGLLALGNIYDELLHDINKAKLTYIQQADGILAHPAFWSPFIQIGNNTPIIIKKGNNIIYWVGFSFLVICLIILTIIKSKRKFA